jgi:hypothetical protein
MIRTTLTTIAIALSAIATPAKADTAQVWCFTQQAGHQPTETKTCSFSQSGGNVSVYRGRIEYRFNAEQQGKLLYAHQRLRRHCISIAQWLIACVLGTALQRMERLCWRWLISIKALSNSVLR